MADSQAKLEGETSGLLALLVFPIMGLPLERCSATVNKHFA